MPRIRRGRSQRRWPPFGVLAVRLDRRDGDHRAQAPRKAGIHINGPVADSVINEDAGARLATQLTDLELAEPVTDDELAKAWRALRDRTRSGKARARSLRCSRSRSGSASASEALARALREQ